MSVSVSKSCQTVGLSACLLQSFLLQYVLPAHKYIIWIFSQALLVSVHIVAAPPTKQSKVEDDEVTGKQVDGEEDNHYNRPQRIQLTRATRTEEVGQDGNGYN